MNANRIWTLSCVVLIGAILAGGYFVGISPMLAAAATADTDRVAVEQQNAGYKTQLESLKSAYADIDTRRTELAAAREVVPDDAEDADFVGELHELQGETGAVITSFVVSDPKAYVPVVTEVPVDPAAAGTEGAEETGEEPATATPTTTTADTTPAVVSTPSVPGADLMTAESFIAIPYTVSVAGTLEQTQDYVTGLQAGKRLFLVTKLAVQYDESTGLFTQDIDGYIWVYRASGGTAEQTSPTTGATVTAN